MPKKTSKTVKSIQSRVGRTAARNQIVKTKHKVVKPQSAVPQTIVESPAQARASASVMPPARLPSAWTILQGALAVLRQHWRLFAGLSAVLAVLNVVFVHNIGADVSSLRSQVNSLVGGSRTTSGLATYGLLLNSSVSGGGGTTGVYQYALLIIGSLAIIWALRQCMSDEPPARLRIRDSFYRGMYPLIPFMLVLIVLTLELLPLVIGLSLYSTVVGSGVLIGVAQQLFGLFIVLLLAILSFWLLTRSLLAIYIVTLPDMTPLFALRSARDISRRQRLAIVRKLLFLVVGLFVVSLIVMIPFILLLSAAAAWVLFALGMLALPVVHAYLYYLYRELLPQ